MYQTKYGPFSGNSWEGLCQQIFKQKYASDGYQEMIASSGDFGIEGFTIKTGVVYQCYCPEKNYTQDELYEKQRDKVTKDLGKLSRYESDLKSRLGDTEIKAWIFVTPDVNHNKILAHARTKQQEVKELGLSILSDDFTVLIHDADFYATEIRAFQTVNGEKINFNESIPSISAVDDTDTENIEYEDNIDRKSKIRCNYDADKNIIRLNKLKGMTVKKWIEGDSKIRKIESSHPQIYYDLARVISQYEDEVTEQCLLWTGTAEELTNKVRTDLYERLQTEIPDMSATDQREISDHMVSKWIALCPLDYE